MNKGVLSGALFVYIFLEEIEMPTFVHTGDVHLDTAFSARFSSVRAELRRKELMMTFESIAEKAAESDLFLISGDLFDSRFVSAETRAFLRRCFASMPDTRVMIAAGNHDPLTADSVYAEDDWGENVHIFSAQMEYVDIPELKTRVHGVSLDRPYVTETVMRDIEIKESWCNILVMHGEVVADGGSSEYNPIFKSDLAASGVTYAALGHIHKPSGIKREGGVCYAYPGIPEGRGFDEDGERGFIQGQADSGGVTADWIPVNRRSFLHVPVDVSGCEDSITIFDRIKKIIDEKGGSNIYKIELTGKLDRSVINCDVLKQQLGDSAFYIELTDHTEPLYDVHEIAKETGLRGAFAAEMLKWISEMPEDEKEIGYTALRLGIDAMKGGCEG